MPPTICNTIFSDFSEFPYIFFFFFFKGVSVIPEENRKPETDQETPQKNPCNIANHVEEILVSLKKDIFSLSPKTFHCILNAFSYKRKKKDATKYQPMRHLPTPVILFFIFVFIFVLIFVSVFLLCWFIFFIFPFFFFYSSLLFFSLLFFSLLFFSLLFSSLFFFLISLLFYFFFFSSPNPLFSSLF